MVELQSCATLVNQSALCAIEEEVKEETTARVIAEISAELQREREKNEELMERISALEAQIQKLDEPSVTRQGSCLNATERSLEKLKRQKVGTSKNGTENGNAIKEEIVSLINQDDQCIPSQNANAEDCLVSWMSMDETQFLHGEKLKKDDSAADCDDTDESVEEDEYEEADTKMDHNNRETNVRPTELKEHHHEHSIERQTEQTFPYLNQVRNEDRKHDFTLPDPHLVDVQNHEKKESNNVECNKELTDDFASKESCHTGPGSSGRKPPKVAFCPKEVKRMLESEVLLSKNAQSHTIRKIIVFASLGIRHGCDDIYELDFNHFSIVRKGEQYVSSKDPGEHVLYENPGIQRKIFYPNWQNPTLCPVQILEEEKAMRPSEPSCPSCLFLCIKYGGRTRNLPQNEYVRQRMGRNKLKSFGPVMCRMAMLVQIRSGSFFFKALGITLLFMAGFPDELVRRETKYRNLDLLQKYYRTDEDAEGEELFLLHSRSCDIQASPGSDKLTGKTASSKSKGRKQANSTSKPCNLAKSASFQESAPSTSAPPIPFGLMGYSSMPTQAMIGFQSIPSRTPTDAPTVPTQLINSSATNISHHNQTPYHMFPPQPASGFMPMTYWPAPCAYAPSPFPTTYSYQPFLPAANYMSIPHPPYYSQSSCSYLIPRMAKRNEKADVSQKDSDVESDSSSSSTETKEALGS